MTQKRLDGRAPDNMRPVSFERDFTTMAMGSVLCAFGGTRVLCTASIQEEIPRWLRGQNQGWITAEYSLLPGSSAQRVRREAAAGRQSGRTMEIQRLIARSLRGVCDLEALGERSIVLDCDVLQADGGTRTAAISGAYVALSDACERLRLDRKLSANPLTSGLAAVSVGIVKGEALLDLDYSEDFRAAVDMNVVMNSNGDFLEIQGTAESEPFNASQLNKMLDLAQKGIAEIYERQKTLLEDLPKRRERRDF